MTAATETHRAANLERALQTRGDMGLYKLTREQAFSALQMVSQHANRKLAELAVAIAGTGELPPPADQLLNRALRSRQRR
jgi:hypothetical protein